jgi:hypothetical protein
MEFRAIEACKEAREILPEGGPFSYPKLYRWKTHIEGSLIHAILNAIWLPYQKGIFEDKALDRIRFVRELRAQLAERLGQPINGSNSSTYYELLLKGNIAEEARNKPELTLERMKTVLRTENFLGEIFLEYLSDYFNLDIYIIDLRSMEVILSRIEDSLLFKRTRESIILGFINNHYELISVKVSETEFPTVFAPTASVIRKIWARRQYLRSQQRL